MSEVRSVYQSAFGPIEAYSRPETQDANTLLSIIQHDEYRVTGQVWNGKVALDVGAHIGGMTLLLLKGGAEFVRCVEPLPENVDMIHKNLEANGFTSRCDVVWGAVGDSDQFPRSFVEYTAPSAADPDAVHRYIGNTVPWPSSASPEAGVAVKTVNLSTLLEGHPVWDLMKIDCEGAEWELFSAASHRDIRRLLRVVGELHSAGLPSDVIVSGFWDYLGTEYRAQHPEPAGVSLVAVDFAR